MEQRYEITNFAQGVALLEMLNFPVRIRIVDEAVRSKADLQRYPEDCRSETMARITLDLIYEDHGEQLILVEVFGEPKTVADHIRSSDST